MSSAFRVDDRPVQDALADSKSDKITRRDWHGKCCVTCGVDIALCGPGRRSVVCCHLSRFIRGRRVPLAAESGCVALVARLVPEEGFLDQTTRRQTFVFQYHTIPGRGSEPADDIREDHRQGRAEPMAKAVPESAGILRNGMAGRGDAGTRCSELDGAQRPGTK